jgi:hypothetical protein
MRLSVADSRERDDSHIEGVEERPLLDEVIADHSDKDDAAKQADNPKGFPERFHRNFLPWVRFAEHGCGGLRFLVNA